MEFSNIDDLKNMIVNYYQDIKHAQTYFKIYKDLVIFINDEFNGDIETWIKYFLASSLYQSVMTTSKLYDKQRDSFSLIKFVQHFTNKNYVFLNSNKKFYEQIEHLNKNIELYNNEIERLKKRRNRFNAHYDFEYLINKKNVQKDLPLFFDDKENLLSIAEKFVKNVWKSITTDKLTFTNNIDMNALKEDIRRIKCNK
ncbi:hypothetical protein IJD44_03185 [bacterium]|nr:hypothetical protein [bacterium]